VHLKFLYWGIVCPLATGVLISVWTIVLGMVFVAAVLNRLSMMEFNETLLALMGISRATSIGFKSLEDPK
jgi:hypothetical protein